MHEHGCSFIMMVPTTLFKCVHSSSHEQSVPTFMNKPVNNHVQAGQLNQCSSWPAQPGSSWPAQPCSSLSTGKDKLCILTCVYTSYFLLGLARWYDRLCEKTEIKESIRRVLWSRSNNHRRCRQSQATKGDVFIYIHCTLCLYLKPRLHPAITRPGLSSWLMRFIQK